MKIDKKQAKEFLKDVNPDKSFWINNGPIINNLKQLPKAIEKIDDNTFRYHVNKEKNDFSKWIDETIGDKTLSRNLRGIRTKQVFQKKLMSRIQALRRIE
ncbi:MAG: DUF5752 family protein [Candidatus Woesearchaeota archaeon]